MTDVLIKRELLEDLRDAANDCLNHEIMRGNDRNVPAYTELVEQADMALAAPLDAFMKHAGVNDLATFTEWLAMRRSECIRMHARYDLGERDKGDGLYEWTIARATVFNEVHINFKPALAEIDTLRQQLAERDATIERLEAGIPRIQEQSHQMRQVRDKLEGLLRDLWEYTHDPELEQRIEAALAEVKP